MIQSFLKRLPRSWLAIVLATSILTANAALGWAGFQLGLQAYAFYLIGFLDGIGISLLAIHLVSEKFQVLAVGVGTGSIAPGVAQNGLSTGFEQLSTSLTDLGAKIARGLAGPAYSDALAGPLQQAITVVIVLVFLSLVCNLVLS